MPLLDEDHLDMPHNLEAEQSVIGAILLSQSFSDADALISEDKFYDSRHGLIFKAMRSLYEDGDPIDIVSITTRLQETKEVADAGGVSYISNLEASVPSAANLSYYAGVVNERYLRRQLIIESHRIIKEARTSEHATEAIAGMQFTASNLADQAVKEKEFRRIKEVTMKAFEGIEDRYNSRNEGVTGIPSGYIDLDRMTSGFQRSDLIIVAARPSVGKTAFALNISQNASIRAKKNVAIFSLEMSAEQLVQRMMSSEQNIDASRMRTGYLENDDWEKITMAIGSLSSSQIFIDDSPTLTVQEIAGKCRRLQKQEGLDMILIDYLQLITGRGKRENRQQEVSEISRTLKAIARELDIPVIALSQLSRGVEQRQDKRPLMSDLRESGSIEQDADIVAFLYRDDYYNAETEKKNVIEIIIAKQRNGPVGTVELAFLKNYNKFITLDRSNHEEPAMNNSDFKVPDMHRK